MTRDRSTLPATIRRAAREAPAITVITALTALTGIVQFAHPALVASWRRDTVALQAGQWWRLITPMLVQGSGLIQYAFNLAGSALVGPTVERRYGSRAVVCVYLVGGLAGMAFEYGTDPTGHGSGSSNAVAALVGALWWHVASHRRRPASVPAAIYASYFGISILALRLGGPLGSTVAGAVLAAAASMLLRRSGPAGLTRLVLATVLIPALVLVVLLDSHGIGVGVGALLGATFTQGQSTKRHFSRRNVTG